MKYISPESDVEFTKYWNKLIDKVTDRDNFHESHLEQLRLLCNLYVDYDDLTKFVKENGWTYTTEGRAGSLLKEFPQVNLRQKCYVEIRNYCRILDLVLGKDRTQKEQEVSEWD